MDDSQGEKTPDVNNTIILKLFSGFKVPGKMLPSMRVFREKAGELSCLRIRPAPLRQLL
jgi:hypothetical protein